MADRMTTAQPSFNVADPLEGQRHDGTAIRGVSAPRQGYRMAANATLPGRPDLVFRKQRIAVFLDGCFWHACPQCSRLQNPTWNTGTILGVVQEGDESCGANA